MLAVLAAVSLPALAAPDRDELGSSSPARDGLTEAFAVKEAIAEDLLALPGVVGTGVGRSVGDHARIVVFVADVPAAQAVGRGVLDRLARGVPTQIVVSGEFEALDSCPPAGPDAFCDRPVPAGVSVGHPGVTAGSLGALVTDAGGHSFILGNNHILANENLASIGDDVLQPGPLDGGDIGNPDHVIGQLADYVPLQFCDGACDASDPTNAVDAAVASVDLADVNAETFCGWEPSSTVVPPNRALGITVHKCGRSTDETTDPVAAIDVSMKVGYVHGDARFEDQILVQHSHAGDPFGLPGDSGSLIVDDEFRPVALLHAGNAAFTLGNPIGKVLNALDVAVEGEKNPLPSTTTTTAPPAPPPATAPPAPSGYWMLERDGTIYGFGDAPTFAPVHGTPTPFGPAPAIAIDARRDGQGVWVLDAAGVVHPRGTANNFGNVVLSGLAPGEALSSLSATPDSGGYWVYTNLGRTIPFGNAQHYGDLLTLPLNGPVIASVATPTGLGYYAVGGDGGVFAFGDAGFFGSTGGMTLNEPVVGLVPDPDGIGYWLTATDGGMFSFAAEFRGSLGGIPLNKPVVGAVSFADGYLMVAADGGIFNFSSEPFFGSLGATPPDTPVVAVAAFVGTS